MSLTDLVVAPFRFVENEFESIVTSVYDQYHRMTKKSNFELSTLYLKGVPLYGCANGALVYLNQPDIGGLLGGGIIIWISFQFSVPFMKMNRLAEKSLEEIPDGTMDVYMEKYKSWVKNYGRAFLFTSLDSLAQNFFGESVVNYVWRSTLDQDLPSFYGTLITSLLAFGFYTSAIDTNNPKKSSVVEFFRNLRRPIPQPIEIPVEEKRLVGTKVA